MKLKKVLSLVLGGVMALSMLTACGSSSTTSTEEVTAEVAASTTNTAVVSYIQSKMNASDVGSKQANTTLTGKESDHKDYVVTLAKNKGLEIVYDIDDVSKLEWYDTNVASGNINYSGHNYGGKTYAFALEKEGNSDTDLAEAILQRMELMYESSKDYFRYANISVFDAELTYDYYSSATNLTIGGTTVMDNTREFWVVVVTTSADSTAQTGTY